MYGGFSFVPYDSVDHGARSAANSASSAAREAKSEVETLRLEVERLLMVSEALWSILKEKHGYEDDELVARVREIDMRDGRLDGRMARSAPVECPKCNRVVSRNRPVCLYCGATVPQDLFGL